MGNRIPPTPLTPGSEDNPFADASSETPFAHDLDRLLTPPPVPGSSESDLLAPPPEPPQRRQRRPLVIEEPPETEGEQEDDRPLTFEELVAMSPHLHPAARENPFFLMNAPPNLYAVTRRKQRRRRRFRSRPRYDFDVEVLDPAAASRILSFQQHWRNRQSREEGSVVGVFDEQPHLYADTVVSVHALTDEFICVSSSGQVRTVPGPTITDIDVRLTRITRPVSKLSLIPETLRSVGDGRRLVIVATHKMLNTSSQVSSTHASLLVCDIGVALSELELSQRSGGRNPMPVVTIDCGPQRLRMIETYEGKVLGVFENVEEGEEEAEISSSIVLVGANEQIEIGRIEVPFHISALHAASVLCGGGGSGLEDVLFVAGRGNEFWKMDLVSGDCLLEYQFNEPVDQSDYILTTHLAVDKTRGVVFALRESFHDGHTQPSRCVIWNHESPLPVRCVTLEGASSAICYSPQSNLVCFARRRGWIEVRDAETLEVRRRVHAHDTRNPIVRIQPLGEDRIVSLAEDAATPLSIIKPQSGEVVAQPHKIHSCRGLAVVEGDDTYLEAVDELERVEFLTAVIVQRDIPVRRMFVEGGLFVLSPFLLDWKF